MGEIPFGFLTGWTIVVVDDEFDSLTVAKRILEFHGAAVYTAETGVEGLALIKSVLPRLVISDLSMPEMDGSSMLNHLREHEPTRDIPVIALTAHAMMGDRERVLAAGFNSYLTKPINAGTFTQCLVDILREIPELNKQLSL
jgi:two-component system cell cycle response regulator DivK